MCWGACNSDSFGKQVNVWDVSFHTKTCRTQNIEHIYWTVSFIQMQFLFFFVWFFYLFFPVQSDFRIHRTRRKPIAPGWTYCFKPPNFVYMSCMPHRWYYVYTKITPTPITVYHSNYRKKLSVFFAMKFNWETLYIYVFISNTYIHINIYIYTHTY